jgi:hypothetical protein
MASGSFHLSLHREVSPRRLQNHVSDPAAYLGCDDGALCLEQEEDIFILFAE